MCGICGVRGLEDKKLIKRMTDVVEHRGPDDSGYFIDKEIMLGHRRLSIIDIDGGRQPIYNEDKSLVVVYNGEIYNFKELRKELEAKGHRFSTETDTEVIVHAYEEYGEECFSMFNGIFAFALWDIDKKELFLGRDRVGVKPLFYAFVDGVFLFGSEIKSLLQYGGLKREVDLDGLHYYMNLRFVPYDKTMFRGVKKLLPGHTLVFKDGRVDVRKFWSLRMNALEESEEYFSDKLKKVLESSIKRQMIADVPVASYLSGGLDSSTIVSYASKFTDKLQTFCMGFGEPTDEFRDAKMVAEKFGTDHKELIVKFDIMKTLPETIWAIDMPKRNMWPYFIAQKIKNHVKVVLSGMGGDEVLGGYIYRYDFMKGVGGGEVGSVSEVGKVNKKITEIISKRDVTKDHKLKELYQERYSNDGSGAYSLITHNNKLYSDLDYLQIVYGDKLSEVPLVKSVFDPYFGDGGLSVVEQTFLAEFNTKMVDDFLLVEDATSMANSLESRVPFLDNEMIDLCFRMPIGLKIRDNDGKYILRKVMKDVLPKEIINKKKWGFIPNTYSWFKNEFRDIALDKLPKSSVVKDGFFDKGFIMKILEKKPDEKLSMHYNYIWNLLCAEVWYNLYFKNDNLFKPKLDVDYLLG